MATEEDEIDASMWLPSGEDVKLGTCHGDPASEMNVLRLVRWCRANPPYQGKFRYFTQDCVNITPGLAQVIAAIPWMKIRG